MNRVRSEDRVLDQFLEAIGLPDDFSETVLAREVEPTAETLQRIKKQTLARVPQAPHRRRRPLFKRTPSALTAAVILLFTATLAMAWVGPERVWAGVQRILTLVPGFGLVDKEEQDEWVLFARQKVRVEGEGGFVEVSGLLANPHYTGLQLYIEGLPGYVSHPEPQVEKKVEEKKRQADHDARWESYLHLYLLDDAGTRYDLPPDAPRFLGGSGAGNQAWLQFPPLDRATRQVTLVVPLEGGETLRAEVPLTILEDEADWNSCGTSSTEKDITVSAAAFDYTSIWIAISVHLNDRKGRVVELGRYFPGLPADQPLTLTGPGGRQYSPQLRGQGGMTQNYFELFFEGLEDGENQVQLTVPLLQIREKASAKVKVGVPVSSSQEDLDLAVTLGRFDLKLTRAEKICYGDQDYLRIYVDLGPAGTETLEEFTLDGNQSWGCTFDQETGRMRYLEIPMKGNPSRVTLTLADPVYSVIGPWVLDLPVQR
ncbi:MAG: hypothetical protein GX364_06145 [Firmicutes bacterium]|jgi:hypothetical protein|nr:hypothetical protein [Bacillota bacterium]